MSKGIPWVVVVISAGLLAVGAAVRADTSDLLLASVNQFQLDNGETKTMLGRPAIKAYRVCMEEGRGAVPLRVSHDGQEVIVEPGECRQIEATKIKLASAARLDDGLTLIGSYGPPRSDRVYKTDVSLAQAALDD